MRITGPITLSQIRSMLRGADRAVYMRKPPDFRKRALTAYRKCSEDGESMPSKMDSAFDLTVFAFLFELIEESLPATEKHKAGDFSIAITKMLTLRPVRLEGSVMALVRVDPRKILYTPSHPSLSPIGLNNDDNEEFQL